MIIFYLAHVKRNIKPSREYARDPLKGFLYHVFTSYLSKIFQFCSEVWHQTDKNQQYYFILGFDVKKIYALISVLLKILAKSQNYHEQLIVVEAC